MRWIDSNPGKWGQVWICAAWIGFFTADLDGFASLGRGFARIFLQADSTRITPGCRRTRDPKKSSAATGTWFVGCARGVRFVGYARGARFVGCARGVRFVGYARGARLVGCARGARFVGCARGARFVGCARGARFVGCARGARFLGYAVS